MSDTDDTDSLLSVAAPSGLTNFLGLSVEEMSSRINTLTNNSNTLSNNNHSGISSGALTREDVRRAEYVKNDIFCQLAEYSDSDDDDDGAKSDTGSEGSTASTNSITMYPMYPSETKENDLKLTNLPLLASVEEGGTPTVTTTTVAIRNSSTPNHENFEQQDIVTFQKVQNYGSFDSNQQVVKVDDPRDEKYKLPTYGVRVSHGIDFMRQSPHTTGWRYTIDQGSDPQIIQRAPNFRTPGGYKPPLNPVPPRDLSDAQVHEEVKKMYAFPDDDDIDPDCDHKNQSSSPAVNNHSESKKLTTGRHPAGSVDDGGGDGRTVVVDNEKTDSTDVDSQVLVQNDKEEETKSNNNDVVDSAACGGVKENPFIANDGKPVKRKLFSAGDTVGSIPDLGFGLRDFDKLEAVETPVVPSKSWLSDVNSGGGQSRHRNDKHYFPSTGSAQFRDENDLEISPIKAAYLENSKNSPDISRCLPRVPRAARQLKKNYISSPKKVSLLELDLLWKDIQRTKSAMEEEMNKESANLKKAVASTLSEAAIQSNNTDAESLENKVHGSKVSFQEDKRLSDNRVGNINQRSSLSSALENLSIGDVDSSEKNVLQQKSILKSKSPGRVKKSATTLGAASPSRQLNNLSDNISFDLDSTSDDLTMMSSLSLYDSSAAFLPSDLDTIDFSSILSAAHMKPSEFDDILSRLDDFSEVAIEQMTGADEEIEDVVTKLEVADWAKSGATEYVQKYYDEKNRRELCETENENLNKIMLKLKQELAVRSTMLKKKDGVLLKMTKAWHDITSKWKDHEKSSREILQKLQQDHTALLEYSKKSKERIDCYEKELASAVDLAGTFKSKLEALEKTHCDNVEKLEGENNVLKEKFVHLENTLDSIKDEKDAAVRALSESQKQLDERNAIHEELQEKLTFVQLESKEGQKDFMKIVEQKKSLEEYLQSVTVQKDALETQVAEVLEKLEDEKAEKERLKSMVTQEIESQVKEKQERLQEYYTTKLQQQSEEAVAKEVLMVNSHQQELMELEKNLLKILEDCKKSCFAEMNKKNRRYEKEIQSLRQELTHKQHFISKMSREFYEQAEPAKEADQSICGRGRIEMKKLPSSPSVLVSKQSEKDIDAASICSSNGDSTINQKFPKYRRSGPTIKNDDGDVSSTDEFNPSQLGKYNVSTPTSGLITPTTITATTKVIGWRELPNIQHLLTPMKDEPSRVLSISNSNAPQDENQYRFITPSNITPSREVRAYNYNECVQTNLDSTPQQVVSEQRIRKCIQTLMKVYSSSLNDGSNNNNNNSSNKDGEASDTCSTITQIKPVAMKSPLTTTKLIQQQKNSHQVGLPAANELNRRNSATYCPANQINSNFNKEQGKQSLKPPWK